MSGEDTVKEWCTKHCAPLLWIVSKEQRKAIETLISVQKDRRTLDQDVVTALSTLKAMDSTFLSDDNRIVDALMETVGTEFRDIFDAERNQIIAKAKMSLGNNMGTGDVDGLKVFQNILKKAQQEKAKREKLSSTKKHVQTMNEGKLRDKVQAFLDVHPEYCDDFNQ